VAYPRRQPDTCLANKRTRRLVSDFLALRSQQCRKDHISFLDAVQSQEPNATGYQIDRNTVIVEPVHLLVELHHAPWRVDAQQRKSTSHYMCQQVTAKLSPRNLPVIFRRTSRRHVSLRLGKHNQQQRRIRRCIISTPHIALRLVELFDQFLNCRTMQESMRRSSIVKVPLHQSLSVRLRRQDEE
jgi:hypothetical protein